jgi:hypothetical protein
MVAATTPRNIAIPFALANDCKGGFRGLCGTVLGSVELSDMTTSFLQEIGRSHRARRFAVLPCHLPLLLP